MPHTHQYVVWIVLPCREVTTAEYVVGNRTIIIVAEKIILLFVGFPTKFCFSHRFNFGNIMCVHTGYGYSSTSSVDDVPRRTRTLLLLLDPLLA